MQDTHSGYLLSSIKAFQAFEAPVSVHPTPSAPVKYVLD